MALITSVLVLSIKNCGLTPCHKLVIMEVQNLESMHMNLLLHPFYPQNVDGALLWPLRPFWQQKDSVCFWWCVRCCIAVGQRLQCLIKDTFHFYYPYNLNHSKKYFNWLWCHNNAIKAIKVENIFILLLFLGTAQGIKCSGIFVCVCVLVLCLGQLKLFQPVFPQVISGQVFPGHQPDHLKIQRETKSEHSIQNILHIVSDQSVRNHAKKRSWNPKINRSTAPTLFSSSTTTRCLSPRALNSLKTRGRDVSCKQITSF